MNFLLRVAIIALLSVAGALLFVMLLCWVSDPSQQEIRNLFVLIMICIAAVLVSDK